MPRYDLNGDPLPEDSAAAPPPQPQYAPQQQPVYGQAPSPYGQAPPPPPYGQAPPLPYGQPPAYGQPAPPPYGQPQYPGQYPPPQGQYGAAPQPGQRRPLTTVENGVVRFVDQPGEPVKQQAMGLLAGGAIALVIGIVGSIGIMKLLFAVGMGFGLFYILLGGAVGFCVGFGAKNGGGATIGIATAVMAISLFIGHVVYVNDAMAKYPDVFGSSFATAFPAVMSHFGIMHWIFVVLACVYALKNAAAVHE